MSKNAVDLLSVRFEIENVSLLKLLKENYSIEQRWTSKIKRVKFVQKWTCVDYFRNTNTYTWRNWELHPAVTNSNLALFMC